MEFFENLSVRYNALTRQSQRVADYIRQHPAETVKMTAKSLGDASGTSAAAVVRLCQQLGYESLESMKISLAKGLSDNELSLPIDTIISGGDSVADIAQKLYAGQHLAWQETLEMLDYDEVKEAVKLLQKAQHVYLFGIGSSGLVASELCHRLNRIGKPCIFLSDGHTNLEYASVATQKDLLIAFSYSGETTEVYYAAERARENNVPVVAVTRNAPSTLSALATITLNVPKLEKRVRVGAFTSIKTQMFIADILYMSFLNKDFDKYEDMLVETSRLANKLRKK